MKLSAIGSQLSARNKARVKGNQEQRQKANSKFTSPHLPADLSRAAVSHQPSAKSNGERQRQEQPLHPDPRRTYPACLAAGTLS